MSPLSHIVTVTDLVGNRGRNLHNIAGYAPDGAELGVVAPDSVDVSVLGQVDEHGIPSEIIECGDDEAYESHRERILGALADYDLDLVCLDGYMRVPTSTFLDAVPTALSVYLSLLPTFPGTGAHEQVLDAGVKTIGCTVHVVNKEIDAGPIVTQEVAPVYTDDNTGDLRSRVPYDAELKAYPRTVRWFAKSRVTVGDSSVTIEGDIDAGLLKRRVTPEDRYDELRHGGNPYQDVTIYVSETCDKAPVVGTSQLNEDAKGLSYNNRNDADGALNIIKEFDEPTTAAIKHTNPAGCATADVLVGAYVDAFATDPMNTFDSIIVLNCECDAEIVELIIDSFKEIIVTPGYIDDAFNVLTEKKNLRVFDADDLDERTETHTGEVLVGGRLVQEHDPWTSMLEDLEVVTGTEPMDEQLEVMPLARTVLKHVKSNGILSARGTETIGVGMGRVSRVGTVELAAVKVKEYAEDKDAQGVIIVSGVFFSFPDGVEKAADASIEAVIQPGGSASDEDIIAAYNERGIAMAFTGQRCSRHD